MMTKRLRFVFWTIIFTLCLRKKQLYEKGKVEQLKNQIEFAKEG